MLFHHIFAGYTDDLPFMKPFNASDREAETKSMKDLVSCCVEVKQGATNRLRMESR